CVLGNPPWERIKLQEEEFFATRHRDVAEAKNKAERSQRIGWLAEGMLARHLFPELEHAEQECAAEQRVYAEFITARRAAEAMSLFAHVKGEDGGRYPLTGVGDVNTYALFAETFAQLMAPTGRAGFIVPTGIATDDSTKAFFAHITQNARLVSLYDIENRERLFPAVDSRMKFCLLTLGQAAQAEFVCFATRVEQLADSRRRFRLTPEEFRRLNPNTLTCPVFRSARDAELTKKLYRAAPVLIEDRLSKENSWGLFFHTRFFHMAEDSHHFLPSSDKRGVAIYEAKMMHIYDHRWATYDDSGEESRVCSILEKSNPSFELVPRYRVDESEFKKRVIDANIGSGGGKYFISWRWITNATNERTVIASVLPQVAVSNSLPTIFFRKSLDTDYIACFVANLSAIVLDYCARQKIGGTNMTLGLLKQLPVFSIEHYSKDDLRFISSRVLELTYTSTSMESWASDLGYQGMPFQFNPDRRAQLRAELDAYYARLYGLTRDELRYILDPSDIIGDDYPSETFRVLQKNEMREFGEYRTQRLVLAAWDALQTGVPR
ncbi:SAM-dependent DNA methyltransferase, partial [Acidithiobacillus ferrivorans]|nr:SAM-dependent DNA methyltransferase [Acidithiobacillus ferrivorans]